MASPKSVGSAAGQDLAVPAVRAEDAIDPAGLRWEMESLA